MSAFPSVKHKLMKVIYSSVLSLPKKKTGKITKKLKSSSGLPSVIKKAVEKATCKKLLGKQTLQA